MEARQQERKDRQASLDDLEVLGQQPPATPISPDYEDSLAADGTKLFPVYPAFDEIRRDLPHFPVGVL